MEDLFKTLGEIFKEAELVNSRVTEENQKRDFCGRCGKPVTDDKNEGDYCNKYHDGQSGMFCRGKIVHEAN